MNQAAGIVAMQASCQIEQAFTLMRERAGDVGLSLDDIAAAVLDRSIQFGE